MRFITNSGVLSKARRFISRPTSISDETKDPVKLAEILRQLSLRVSELEARTGSEGIEFERDTTGTAGSPEDVELFHGLGGPVRWYLTVWRGSMTAAPIVVEQTTSNSNQLDLKVYSTGRMVVRIEPSQYGLS